MPQKQSNKKKGRNASKGKRYRDSGALRKNKLKHILQSNGLAAAELYAQMHNMVSSLRSMSSYQRKKELARK